MLAGTIIAIIYSNLRTLTKNAKQQDILILISAIYTTLI